MIQASSTVDNFFDHEPVMVTSVVALCQQLVDGFFLDATLGGAGHAQAVLDAKAGLTMVGLDQDPNAVAVARTRLAGFGDRVQVHHQRFDRLADVLERQSVPGLVGFLFDLGVSSPQLDTPERGFSFRNDGPLDMRMNPEVDTNANTIVNTYDEPELSHVLRKYGDERFSRRIAAAIIARRPITSTKELAQIVVDAIPAAARRTGGHPAKRTFQAIRIEVNSELEVLSSGLRAAIDSLLPGGRGLVLTYHSGEDRIVKRLFRTYTESTDPQGLPTVHHCPKFALVRPAVRRPDQAEIEANPRARSARLRLIERMAA